VKRLKLRIQEGAEIRVSRRIRNRNKAGDSALVIQDMKILCHVKRASQQKAIRSTSFGSISFANATRRQHSMQQLGILGPWSWICT